jgi:hypothetical protein
MQRVILNYSDSNFASQQKVSSFFAKKFGNADKVFSFNPNDIDEKFKNKNKEILNIPKGGGLWLWKPYIINKLLEQLNLGDYLFYQDSGSILIRKVDYFINSLESKKQSVLCFELPLIEKQWTKQHVFDKLNLNSPKYRNTNQRLGGYILFKKSNESVEFVNEWLELSCELDLIGDDLFNKSNYHLFKDHRNDQSIFSLLTKKYGFIPDSDPSHRGIHLEPYLGNIILPLKKNKYPVMIIANRGRNILNYLCWFYLYYLPKMKLYMKLKNKKHIYYEES